MDITDGSDVVTIDGEDHEIGCMLHRGVLVVDTEERIDPATNQPRLRTFFDAAGHEQPYRDEEGNPEIAQFPIYSEQVGFQNDCPDCQQGAFNTSQHVAQKRLSREARVFELQRLFGDNPDLAKQVGGV